MICHKNGKAITKPPRIRAACTNTCGCLWKKPSCTRRVCLRPDLLRRVGSWGAVCSDIVHPPVLQSELHQREERDDHHDGQDRKSTRLNSSHVASSYAVFCVK